MPSFPQIALCFPSFALRPQPFNLSKSQVSNVMLYVNILYERFVSCQTFVGMQCAWLIDRLATTLLGMRGLCSQCTVHRHSVNRHSVHRLSVHTARSGKVLVCSIIIDREALVKLSLHVPRLFLIESCTLRVLGCRVAQGSQHCI